ncbi:CDP-alcohol phosphatidyltransferase family protein, partial [Streptomyces sp. NPDC088135]
MSTAILTGALVPGSSLTDDLRSLGFDVQVAADAAEAARLLSAVPADRRVALVDPRFVGHVHALRLGLTDPRFPAATVPGALTAQPEARPALVSALDATAEAVGAGAPTGTSAVPVADRTLPGR